VTDTIGGWGPDDAGLPCNDVLAEHAYLIARGVRALALSGYCPADPVVMLRASTRLFTAAGGNDVLPFVIDFGDGSAACGYAAAKWVIDLYEFVMQRPHPHRSQILGLLLGYSPPAISRHLEHGTGRRYTQPGDTT
jgi:hypothetical protein